MSIISLSASGSATLRTPTPRATGGQATRRAGRSRRDAEEDGGRPALASLGRDQDGGEARDQREANDRERVRDVGERGGDRGRRHGVKDRARPVLLFQICSTFATDTRTFHRYDQIGEEVGGTFFQDALAADRFAW